MKRQPLWVALFLPCAVFLTALHTTTSQSQEHPNPLTRNSLNLLLRAKQNDPQAVVDIITQKGIAFLPTKVTLTELADLDVHIIEAIKKPENYTRYLRVHVCHYFAPTSMSADEAIFADRLFFELSNEKDPERLTRQWPLLRGMHYDDHVGPIACFDVNNPKQPGISYVTIRGALSPGAANRKHIETIFTYLPLGGGPQPLGQSLKGDLKDDSADEIVRESLKRLEDTLK